MGQKEGQEEWKGCKFHVEAMVRPFLALQPCFAASYLNVFCLQRGKQWKLGYDESVLGVVEVIEGLCVRVCHLERFCFEKRLWSPCVRTNVETNGGDGGNNLTELEFVEDGGLSSGVEADHEDTHLLLAEALEQLFG